MCFRCFTRQRRASHSPPEWDLALEMAVSAVAARERRVETRNVERGGLIEERGGNVGGVLDRPRAAEGESSGVGAKVRVVPDDCHKFSSSLKSFSTSTGARLRASAGSLSS